MSLYSTSSPSIEQTRLYLTRPPSAACTWLNRMSLSSVAEYSFTPMLTRPNDTAPRQIDRMPPLPDGGPDPVAGPRDAPVSGSRSQDRSGRVPAAGPAARHVPRTEDGPPRPRLVDTLGLRSEPAVLDAVVHELQDIGPRDHRHRQRREPGGLRCGDVAEHEAGADPLGQAEGAGEQLPHGVLDAAVLSHLLGDLGVARRALEPGEGGADGCGHRVLRESAREP